MDNRRNWLSIVLNEGIKLGVVSADDILRHATPAVLATDLPPQQVASLLQAGLETGSFNASMLVEQLGASTLSEHVPLPVLWSCVSEAAERIIADHPASRGAMSADAIGAVEEMPEVSIDIPAAVLIEDSTEIEVIEEDEVSRP